MNAGAVCFGGLLATHAGAKNKSGQAVRITPPEHLMREHAVLERILIVYENAAQRLSNGTYSMQALGSAARMVREVIEDHHMPLEENQIFARFRKQNQQMNLVQTLVSQHRAAREVTDTILSHANETSLKDNAQRGILIGALESYVRMSRPHDAHEGSSLFPLFHTVVSPHEFDAVAEEFERAERQKFGADGYERIIGELAQLETRVGLADLSQFTPRAPATTGNR